MRPVSEFSAMDGGAELLLFSNLKLVKLTKSSSPHCKYFNPVQPLASLYIYDGDCHGDIDDDDEEILLDWFALPMSQDSTHCAYIAWATNTKRPYS